MQVFLRPYNFLSFLGIVLIIISFFVVSSTIDIHLHDTYYIIGYQQFFWLIALIILFFALLYRITNQVLLSKFLTWLQIIITLLSFIALIAFIFWGNEATRRYIDVSAWNSFHRLSVISKIISWIVLIFIFGQVVFIVNIIGGLIKKFSSR
jgi:heme/copper-type cytochrome/quinol oxidase subunit 1